MISQATDLWRVSHKAFIFLQKTSQHLPVVKNIRMWSSLQALIDCIGWLANTPSQLNILGFPWPISTFSYSGCCFTLGSSDALIPKLASLMAQSVMSQGQLKHGSVIRLRLIRMVLALSISERGTELFKICNNDF